MADGTILGRFDDLNTWKQRYQRAPHKPLLVLYALRRWQEGKAVVTYAKAELTAQREFGPARKSDYPEHSFLRVTLSAVCR